MKIEITKDELGIVGAHFYDVGGLGCDIKQSSATGEPKIKLGALVGQRMHLNKEQVAALLPHLRQFVKTGSLLPPEKRKSLVAKSAKKKQRKAKEKT